MASLGIMNTRNMRRGCKNTAWLSIKAKTGNYNFTRLS